MRYPRVVGAWSVSVLAVGALATPAPAAAQQPASSYLVSSSWLADHLGDPEVVIIHVAGSRREYTAEHIPGARFLWFGALAPSNPDLSSEMPPVAQLDSIFESLGVSDRSRIVVYASAINPAAARAFVTLDYLGAGERTALLDGGLAAWKAEGRSTTSELPRVAKGSLTPRVNRDVLVDASFVSANLDKGGVKVLDARAANFYGGAANGSNPRPGRIPSAGSVPFTSLLDEKGLLKPLGSLASMFTEAGVKPGDRVVTYCHVGQQASLLYFAARQSGHRVSLYDGSFEDWSARTDLPVVGPVKP